MRRTRRLSLLFGGALAAATMLGGPGVARGAEACDPCPATGPPSIPCKLEDESGFQVGCLDPCACPVMIRNGLTGTFVLTPLRSGPLFDEYLVCDVDWTVPATPFAPALHITGNGWYRVGGEVAIQQELKLCVSVDGGDLQRLESGLVSGGGSFPRIDIAIAAHGFFCWDTVIAVKAAPVSAGVDDGAAIALLASPNPSSGWVDLDLFLRADGPVTLRILDIQGREVRTLERGAWLPAGRHARRWDGARQDGTRAPAGLYLLTVEADGRWLTRRLVRL